ncbi:MAG TPA: tetratricopeptide repeat protein [Longimicrobium sp.]|nr:tetratricopeptide repeat protein [Longimicrobium sp.]
MTRVKGVHPRLITQPPDTRASLAMLPPLKGLGDDFAWALWYSVWKACAPGDEAPPPPDGHDGIPDRFRAAAESVPELRDEIEILARFAGGYEEPRAASDALLRVGDWAASRALSEPAIQCAEAAAALVPASARRALAAGRMNRLFGEVARAELYYERAITLARHSRNWRAYVRGHVGKGHVKKALGDWDAARAHYSTAARAAVSLSGEKWLAAQTQHDLLALAAEEGALAEALTYAQRAVKWYPRHHARFPALAHDLAFVLVRMGLFSDAVPVLRAVMRAPIPPADQVIGWSTLARAAAGSGDAAAFHVAAENALRLVGLFDLHAAPAFANLACGAHLLRIWEQAEQYARRSLELADARSEMAAGDVARSVLDAVRTRRAAEYASVEDAEHLARILELTAEVAAHLPAWRGPTWKRRRQSGPERLGRI